MTLHLKQKKTLFLNLKPPTHDSKPHIFIINTELQILHSKPRTQHLNPKSVAKNPKLFTLRPNY